MIINPFRRVAPRSLRIVVSGALLVCSVAITSPPFHAAECAGGNCTPGGSGGSPASPSRGLSVSGTSKQSIERDWRTRLLLENITRENYDDGDAAGALVPIIGRQDADPGDLQLTYTASHQQSQYSAYSDLGDTKDTEFNAELAIDALYQLSKATELTGRLSLRNEWSQDDPDAFRAYDVDIFRFDAGIRHEFSGEISGSLSLGSSVVEGAGSGLPPGGPPNPELLYSAELEYAIDGFSIRGGAYRDEFVSPETTGFDLAQVNMHYLDANIRVLEKNNLNLRGGHLQFSDDSEDYDVLTGLWTYYPTEKRRLGLTVGVTHEFREEDETIWIGGIEWMGLLTERNSLFTNTRYSANTTTREREISSEIVLGRTSEDRRHGAAIGFSLQWEHHVYHRHSALFFIRLY